VTKLSIHILLPSQATGGFSELIETLPKFSPDFVVSHASGDNFTKPVDGAFDIVVLDGVQQSQLLMSDVQHHQTLSDATKLVIYNFQDNVQQGINYLASGVTGLFMHEYSTDSLAEKFRAIHLGHVYLEPELAQILAMRHIRKLLQPFNTLCSRDYDVFCLLAEGLTIDNIALQLDVSSKTVFNCQTQIKKLLNLSSKSEIQKFAKIHGII
jgi:two-component system, NarL family, invasion response regulator UvrY